MQHFTFPAQKTFDFFSTWLYLSWLQTAFQFLILSCQEVASGLDNKEEAQIIFESLCVMHI